LDKWLEKDRKKFAAEQANEKKQPAK
jgi:hypothetical protein